MTTHTKKLSLTFGTKCETLELLQGNLTGAVIDPLLKFEVAQWSADPSTVIKQTQRLFSDKVIVRSSAVNEDTLYESQAGHYHSVSFVDPKNPDSLKLAIGTVINSYSDKNPKNQFFIQEQLQGVTSSGVLFSRDIHTLAPYITINYDDETGLTDTITSGSSSNTKTFVVYREKIEEIPNQNLRHLCKTVSEIEELFQNNALDIEFAFVENTLHILQVRPIAQKKFVSPPPTDNLIKSILDSAYQNIKNCNLPHTDLYGTNTLLGVMPDWNPAEMIGVRPRALALSLYKELITDSVWAEQRSRYGYKKPRIPLLTSIAGHAYIDVRVDFNSWLPKNLDDKLSQKLTNYYLDELKAHPESHDKIEFDIVLTSYCFDIETRLQELAEAGFTANEIADIRTGLHEITNRVIGSKTQRALFQQDLDKLTTLEKKREQTLSSDLTIEEKISALLSNCKEFGTLPFAGTARAGFVAVIFLNSMVKKGTISETDRSQLLGSLNTVAKQLSHDAVRLKRGELDRESFLGTYGHLRPGTYDILLDSYADNFELYFAFDAHEVAEISTEIEHSFTPTQKQLRAIVELLQEHKIDLSPEEFLTSLTEAIEAREYAKFCFSKSVSEILRLVKEYGTVNDLDPEMMSHVPIQTITASVSYKHLGAAESLKKLAAENRQEYQLHQHIKFPQLITKPEDIYFFHLNQIEPNYVTTNNTEAPISTTSFSETPDIQNTIVLIENADPGYDWIFSHNIKGLITMYGGANSHMSIRAAELNIPAVIGCGETLFAKWSAAKILRIDCSSKSVVIIN